MIRKNNWNVWVEINGNLFTCHDAKEVQEAQKAMKAAGLIETQLYTGEPSTIVMAMEFNLSPNKDKNYKKLLRKLREITPRNDED